ncbi:TetR/AcrR family transcriptional regulator C-terminal domain-containing protein, partial [Streptomyces sp. NPDC087428]|uniref:TetR/AcrR family transcriptional regulator C-terminal domain-containing protein n=1 Tax=Streptomyces sp. NPDC087428 TaxID=3365788 RepID=UPI0038032D87
HHHPPQTHNASRGRSGRARHLATAGADHQAAEQLLALLTGPIETRSRLGTRTVPTTETRTIAETAVDTFLRAYGPDHTP